MHGSPGLSFQGLNDLRVLHGFLLPAGESRRIRGFAGKPQKLDGAFQVPVELRGTRSDGRDVSHSSAKVFVGATYRAESPRLAVAHLKPYPQSIAATYRTTLFHGDDLHALVRIEGVSDEGIVADVRTAPEPAQWLVEPFRHT